MHQATILQDQLFPGENDVSDPDAHLRRQFTIVIQALLRAAHGTETCDHHVRLFKGLGGHDSILTFNYDLVAERAYRALHEHTKRFGAWLYTMGASRRGLPSLHKMHGSINWEVAGRIKPRQKDWSDFGRLPGATGFNILLPYWEKRIWKPPWLRIWRRAAQRLRATRRLIVWGYSLPLTDLKARELLRLTLRFDTGGTGVEEVCIIDPNPETTRRWREMFINQRFWAFEKITDFFDSPPSWFRT